MFTDLATSAYALSILGLRSANGTSTVILTRVGLNCSTVLGTLVTPVIAPRDGMRTARGWPTLSRGNPTGRPPAKPPSGGPDKPIGLHVGVPYTRRERPVVAGRPGRSVAASASALGAEDRRFESCRPDSVIATRTPLAPQDHHGMRV